MYHAGSRRVLCLGAGVCPARAHAPWRWGVLAMNVLDLRVRPDRPVTVGEQG
jgi:hypothetical protein